ncbi:ATP-dependent Clp protease adaptor containing [Micractinium conductrix]|uniref:ATP-dependent Clp protease adaptor containing n=1 Tax=Micractinium conductrix TaxID=554055 RepID=A0A2P6UZA3_9CHLO|nr:ATP-dependent Clp protease adaptor containing [Micractinium conductrix]|eukprot:PSC67178.1 ATP-dependent Clp protease adaptor containing [Micractinium conductrix]
MRHAAGGDAPPQLLKEDQSSAPAPGFDNNRNRRDRGWKVRVTSPAAVLSAGVVLLVVGAALVATPLALHSARQQGPPPPPPPPTVPPPDSGLDAEGVPFDAAQPAQAEGELRDCDTVLVGREAYEAAAAAAQAALLGGRAADVAPEAAQAALGRLPPLLFGTVFWVLVSEGHPWANGFPAAAAAQVESLNSAFRSLGMQFRLDGVVAVPAPDDESVTQCTERWQALAAGLLGGAERSGDSSSSSSGTADPSDPPLVHVIVCEPEGVRGAAVVLGGGEGGGSGDGVDQDSDLHVCQGSGDGPLPILNFMDLTNDTCRMDFTPGQAARMHALLRAHRPRLFAAASAAPQPQAPLEFRAAWQSAPPPLVVQAAQTAAVQQQAAAAAAAAAAAQPGDAISSATARQVAAAAAAYAAVHAAERYGDPWHQAALAADSHLSGAPQACACLGADALGRVFWTGLLNASYPVAAIRLLVPTQLDGSGGSGGEEGDGEAGGAGGGAAAPWAVPTGAADGEVEVEVWVGDSLNHDQNRRCAAAGNDSNGTAAAPPRLLLPLRQPLHMLPCAAPLAGRFVTVALAAPAAAAQQQPLRHRLCLCQVQALSAVVPAVPAPSWSSASSHGSSSSGNGGHGSSQPLPAAVLNITADMAASQSGGSGTVNASLALASQQLQHQQKQKQQQVEQQQAGQQAGQPLLLLLEEEEPEAWGLSVPTCSSGASSDPGQPSWWSLDTGLDGSWVRGLRLALPFACRNSSGEDEDASSGGTATYSDATSAAAAECVPGAPTDLTVYVGNSPPALLLRNVAAARGSLCATVAALPGQPLQADCGRYMQGRHVTVVSTAQAPALSLCDVQLLGAEELQLSHHMQQPQRLLLPPDQQASFTLPIDGNAGSCVTAPVGAGGDASWQLQLDGSYPLLAVQLAAAPAGNGSLAVELLDGGGAVAVLLQPSTAGAPSNDSSSGGGSGGSGSMMVELAGPTQAAALRVRGFASLCDVRVLASAAEPSRSYQLLPDAGWVALGGEPSDGAGTLVSSSGGGNGGASTSSPPWQPFDGKVSTCLTAKPQPGSTSSGAAVELRLGRQYSVDGVRLVAGGVRPQAVDILPAAGAPCAVNVTLNPWQPLLVACQGGPRATDRLTLQLSAAATAWRPAGRRALQVVARSAGGSPGGNVLDRPSVAPGQDRRRESKRRRPPEYRVLLHNDNVNRREYVVKVLMKVVDGTTVDDAVNIMNEAHLNGLALVAQCAQDQAELYCESLRQHGLISTLEPAGGGSGSGSDGTST